MEIGVEILDPAGRALRLREAEVNGHNRRLRRGKRSSADERRPPDMLEQHVRRKRTVADVVGNQHLVGSARYRRPVDRGERAWGRDAALPGPFVVLEEYDRVAT